MDELERTSTLRHSKHMKRNVSFSRGDDLEDALLNNQQEENDMIKLDAKREEEMMAGKV